MFSRERGKSGRTESSHQVSGWPHLEIKLNIIQYHQLYHNGCVNSIKISTWSTPMGSRILEPIQTKPKALNFFNHSAIRLILGIKMNQVKEEEIRNIDLRKKIGNLQDIDYYVKKRACGPTLKNCKTRTPRSLATMPKETWAFFSLTSSQ